MAKINKIMKENLIKNFDEANESATASMVLKLLEHKMDGEEKSDEMLETILREMTDED
jgi:hypothetical protein